MAEHGENLPSAPADVRSDRAPATERRPLCPRFCTIQVLGQDTPDARQTTPNPRYCLNAV